LKLASGLPSVPLPSVALPSLLRRFLLLSAALTLLCGVAELFAASLLHLDGRYVFPLLQERFPDFVVFTRKFDHLHTFDFFTTDSSHPFMYPAPVALPYALFFRASPRHALACFIATVVIGAVIAAVLLARTLHAHGLSREGAAAFAGSTLLLSYPLWFVLNQANMEAIVWLILSVGLWCFFHDRPYTAAICFAVAGSMKFFPFLYLGLPLARRQYRPIAVALAVAAALTVLSLWIIYPDMAVTWHHLEAAIGYFREHYMLQSRQERGFDHSLFGLLKQLVPTLPPPSRVAFFLSIYLWAVTTLGTALYLVRIRKLPVTNQLLCLTVASVLLPPTSFDYTLLHLYAPWLLLVLYALDQPVHPDKPGHTRPQTSTPRPLVAVMVCFAILFSPLTEFIVGGETVAGPIRAVTLVALFTLALVVRFPHPAFETPDTPDTTDMLHPQTHALGTLSSHTATTIP